MDGACHFENRRSEPKHLVTFRVSVPALAQVIDAPIMARYFETVPRGRTTLPLITGGSATGLSVIGAPSVSAAADDGELYHRRVRPRLRGGARN
jgi:hypothetical protein